MRWAGHQVVAERGDPLGVGEPGEVPLGDRRLVAEAVAAVVGVGTTRYGKLTEYDAYDLGVWALKAAAAPKVPMARPSQAARAMRRRMRGSSS